MSKGHTLLLMSEQCYGVKAASETGRLLHVKSGCFML